LGRGPRHGAGRGDAGASREALRRGLELAQDEEARRGFRELSAELRGNPRNALAVGARTHEQDRGAARSSERETPFRRHRRLRKRLRDRDAPRVDRLLLGPAADDARVRELSRPAFQELALAAARLEQLRTAGGGRLPLFDRYQAGEHREVWRELVSFGAGVREDPRAADALAVAYETMRRVESNVRTIVQRLEGLRYKFAPDGPAAPKTATVPRPHVPPSPNARRAVASFEKEFGTLPLSLRAFYEVVGEVNLIGTHPLIDPMDGAVATDPLVVYGLDEGIVEYDEEGDDEDDQRPTGVTIAPDDLHKANTSGGDAYEISIPDLRADGELLNERHRLMFVDYLRLCFEFGGFPGYEGRSRVPTEIALLRDGLLPF